MHRITCPSGLSGEVRGLKTKEANLLADTVGIRKGTTFDTVLKSCWLTTLDPAHYGGEVDWSKALICDRFYTLVQVRIATYGPDYDFPVQCESVVCREKFEWSINLDTDLVVKAVPSTTREQLAAGNNTFDALIASTGRTVKFKLLVGDDEAKAAKQQKARKDKLLTTSLAARVVSVDGVHGNDKLRFIDDLDMNDSRELLATMDAADGGIETEIEVECPHCAHIQEIQLPFGREFFMPTVKKKPTKTQTTESADSV